MTCKECGGRSETITSSTYSKCKCKLNEAFSYLLGKNVPPAYHWVRLAALEPSSKSRLPEAKQKEIYDLIKTSPDNSYALFGPVGTSKTVCSIALYRHALAKELKKVWDATTYLKGFEYRIYRSNEIPVWRITAKQVLREFHDFAINRPVTDADGREVGGAPSPTVTRKKIEKYYRQGFTSHVVLEEIDKVATTDTRQYDLFEIFDAVTENLGQIVINTNLTKQEFQDMYGVDIVRRIAESCTVIDLFGK